MGGVTKKSLCELYVMGKCNEAPIKNGSDNAAINRLSSFILVISANLLGVLERRVVGLFALKPDKNKQL